MSQIENLVNTTLAKHCAAFSTGKTKDPHFRLSQIKCIISLLKENDEKLAEALRMDYLKPKAECMSEINYCIGRANYAIENLSSWMAPKKVPSDTTTMHATMSTMPEPYGNVLVVAPWNFPIILSLEPVIAAIAAGNTVVLKTSESVANLGKLMKELSVKYLDNECITFIDEPFSGEALTKSKFDFIFFTGGTSIGRMVMEAASKNLTPLILELGGKCPAYVHSDCDIKQAAHKIIQAKTVNAGQICISVNYVLCHKSVVDELIKQMIEVLKEFFGENIKNCPDYGRIVTKEHTTRISNLIASSTDDKKFGGEFDIENKYIQPTIFLCKDFSSNLLEKEIFGPVLPIVAVENEDEAIKYINFQDKPLEIYLFTRSNDIFKTFCNRTSSGGVTRNECFLHMNALELPFGGVGNSGMGKYHGKQSFDSFSHMKSTYDPGYHIGFIERLTYPPYTERKNGWITSFARREKMVSCSIL